MFIRWVILKLNHALYLFKVLDSNVDIAGDFRRRQKAGRKIECDLTTWERSLAKKSCYTGQERWVRAVLT